MHDFNLDDFKQTWQTQEVEPKYDNTEILSMLNKKSRNYVKYIFWISVLEFLLFLGINIYNIFNKNQENSFIKVLEKIGVQKTEHFVHHFDKFDMAMNAITLVITAFFVVKFYLNYRKIHVESNLKKFILQIFNFKKTVNLFIVANIGLVIFSAISLAALSIYFLNNQNIQLSQTTLISFVVEILIIICLSLGLIWVYYKVVYGIILKRLSKNLNQLEEIESAKSQEIE